MSCVSNVASVSGFSLTFIEPRIKTFDNLETAGKQISEVEKFNNFETAGMLICGMQRHLTILKRLLCRYWRQGNVTDIH